MNYYVKGYGSTLQTVVLDPPQLLPEHLFNLPCRLPQLHHLYLYHLHRYAVDNTETLSLTILEAINTLDELVQESACPRGLANEV